MTETSSLKAKALLMRLRCSAFTQEVKDPFVTRAAQASAEAQRGTGRYTKRLLPKAATKELRRILTAAREAHAELTYPWWEGGVGLLPIGLLDRYRATIAKLQDQLVTEKVRFRTYYDRYIREAEADLGTMFRRSDYPEATTMMDRYAIAYDAEPLPDGRNLHYLQSVAERDMADMKVKLEARIDAQIEVAESRKVAEIVDALRAAAEMMGDTEDGKPRRFYRSVVTRLRDKAALLSDINIGASERIQVVADQVTEATKFADDEVKPTAKAYVPAARAKAKNDLERLAALFGPVPAGS